MSLSKPSSGGGGDDGGKGKPAGQYVTRHRSTVTVTESPQELATLEFPVHLPNQNFALISYAGPDTVPAMRNGFGLRIYGTFASFDEADRAASRAQEKGFTLFDLDIVEINHGFFPLPPPRDDDIPEVGYCNDRLAAIMQGHKDHLEKGNKRVEERAEREADTRTSEEVFQDMVLESAQKLFDEWKKSGRKGSAKSKTTRAKVGRMFKEQVARVQAAVDAEDSDREEDAKQLKQIAPGISLVHEEEGGERKGEGKADDDDASEPGAPGSPSGSPAGKKQPKTHGGRHSPSAYTTRPVRLVARERKGAQ